MKNDNEIFESLIAGGLVGAALGVLVSGKKEGATLGAIAGATILATYKASQQAMQTNLPMYVEESGNLFEVQSGCTKKFIRKIEKPAIKLPQHFKLK